MTDSNTASATPAEESVTLEQLADMEFEPWAHAAGEWTPPSNKEWAGNAPYLLPFVRLAWLSMYKTKAELEAMSQSLGGEPWNELVDGIGHSLEFFEHFATILSSAHWRIASAEASALRRAGGAIP